MDQYPFEFTVTIIGADVDYFIETLYDAGFYTAASKVQKQFNKQLKEA